MGANEKHGADHGGEYTPSELALITAWCDQRRNLLEYNDQPPEGIVERTEQAQRTLAKIRAEAKAEALEELADTYGALPNFQTVLLTRAARMRDRANQYKEET